MKRYTEVQCLSDSSMSLRVGTLEDRSYLVVPVTMLVGDTVIQASNARTPEFIPSEVIANSLISSWNGRPTVSRHPKRNGKHISANEPSIYESLRTGKIFYTKFEDNKLQTEAWIDIERSKSLGGDAEKAITKLESGEAVSVSVGIIIETEERKGVSLSGEEYGAVWTDIYGGDHLAILPSSEGACSQSMGCRAGEAKETREMTREMTRETRILDSVDGGVGMATERTASTAAATPVAVDKAASQAPKRDFFSKLLSKFRPAVVFDDGDTDDELRQSLADAIKAVDPAFDWIATVYPDSGVVIYMTYMVFSGQYYGVYKYWRRTYSLSGKTVTLNNDAMEVTPKRVWETVDENVTLSDSEESGSVVSASANANVNEPSCSCLKGAEMDSNRKSVIDSLVSSGKFVEGDRKSLEALSEAGFKALSGGEGEEIAVSAASTPSLTEEQALAALPGLRSMVSKYRAQEEARKTDLVSRLTAAQQVYDETSLKSKPLESLEEIAALVGLNTPQVDFSLRGLPPNPAENRAAATSPPDGWMAALEKGRAAQPN